MKEPTLDPTHALMHLPSLFHVPVATGDVQEHANKWVVLILVALGAFMTTLDSSIVNIGLPAIAHNFGVGVSGSPSMKQGWSSSCLAPSSAGLRHLWRY